MSITRSRNTYLPMGGLSAGLALALSSRRSEPRVGRGGPRLRLHGVAVEQLVDAVRAQHAAQVAARLAVADGLDEHVRRRVAVLAQPALHRLRAGVVRRDRQRLRAAPALDQ